MASPKVSPSSILSPKMAERRSRILDPVETWTLSKFVHKMWNGRTYDYQIGGFDDYELRRSWEEVRGRSIVRTMASHRPVATRGVDE
jgi:hypothetical protein